MIRLAFGVTVAFLNTAVAADLLRLGSYARIFGRPAPRMAAVGVRQDSERTGSRAVADLAALVWTAPKAMALFAPIGARRPNGSAVRSRVPA